MEALGLEYRYLARYLRNLITKEQLLTELAAKIWQYAKRQKMWFKRNKEITWFTPTDTEAIERHIQSWLQSRSDR
jgi:tRNA dimethylallyltransferase